MANAADTAANFGYSMTFFNSSPELKTLLNSAVKGNWTPQQFVAKLQATKWFKTHGEAARQIYALKTSDPATYNQRLNSAKEQVKSLAWGLGAAVPGTQIGSLAANALAFGWTDEQIKSAMMTFIKPDAKGVYRGGAAAVQSQLKELAGQYGIKPTSKQMGTWVSNITRGVASMDVVKQSMQVQTASRYPALKDRIMAGETLDDIAAPYKDSYSRILEVNPEMINLTEGIMQQAFSAKDDKGRPYAKTVWEFEKDLKSDPRWLKTNNARSELVGTTRKLLADFGLAN